MVTVRVSHDEEEMSHDMPAISDRTFVAQHEKHPLSPAAPFKL